MLETQRRPNLEVESELQQILEQGPNPSEAVEYTTALINLAGSEYLNQQRGSEVESGLALREAESLTNRFRKGVGLSIELAEELLRGKTFDWWNIDEYRNRMRSVFDKTSEGQFVAVLGPYALNRIAGTGPIMVANHSDLFPDNDGIFLDGLTNATVTNFGQGFPPQILVTNSINRITGGAQCPPYHPGLLMDKAAEALISISPIPKEGAKVAWFNSGGDAVSVAIAAAEKYTQDNHGDNGRRKAVYFKEAYHGNIEGRAGRVTGGINEMFHHEDRNSVELEYPNRPDEVEPVLEQIKSLIEQNKLSCIVFESTQGDGGGISMDPDFFVELMKLSLDHQIPLICDEVQTGFGRSGKVFDVEYLLEDWKNSSYVKQNGYPENPPLILAVAKSMTNGAVPGSAVVFPKVYAVLKRAQGLNTYSAHPMTLAATIATIDLMRPETLQMVARKRRLFEEAIAPFVGEGRLIKGLRGHGLHLFLAMQPGTNQVLQVELLGRKRILTGTVARNALRIHAPLNAPDVVWQAIAYAIGETASEIEQGYISPQTLQILQSGPSGLAER